MKHGEQIKLAEKIGYSAAYISEVIRGIRRPSVKAAVLLEKATDIDRRAWLYPEEFHNPLIEPAKASNGN